MKNSNPQQYFGLLYSEYPDKNGLVINNMAQKNVTSENVRSELVNQINDQIDSTFQSRTTDWNDADRDVARTDVLNIIEKSVNDAFDRVTFH